VPDSIAWVCVLSGGNQLLMLIYACAFNADCNAVLSLLVTISLAIDLSTIVFCMGIQLSASTELINANTAALEKFGVLLANVFNPLLTGIL
jgi:hypothetical protein